MNNDTDQISSSYLEPYAGLVGVRAAPEGAKSALVPKGGARLVMGTDGLWDLVDWRDAVHGIRRVACASAASRLVSQAVLCREGPITDDVSAVVLDILPPGCADFPKVVKDRVKRLAGGNSAKGRWAFARCLATHLKHRVGAGAHVATPDGDSIDLVANMDGWELVKLPRSDSCSSLSGIDCEPALEEEEEEPGANLRQWAPAFLSAQRASLDSGLSAERRRLARVRSVQAFPRVMGGGDGTLSGRRATIDEREESAVDLKVASRASAKTTAPVRSGKGREGASGPLGQWSLGSVRRRASSNGGYRCSSDAASLDCLTAKGGKAPVDDGPFEVTPPRSALQYQHRKVHLALRPVYEGEDAKERILYNNRRRTLAVATPDEGEGNGQPLYIEGVLPSKHTLQFHVPMQPPGQMYPVSVEPRPMGVDMESDSVSDDEVSLSAWGPETSGGVGIHTASW
eukprot:evm.model.scf_539.4 EVM.evm.TU.scf_539.4   scf_539:26890-28640(-)